MGRSRNHYLVRTALFQYFTCSLLSVRSEKDRPVDMKAFYERQRAPIFASFFAFAATNMFQNWWDRPRFPANLNWLYVTRRLLGC
ncbi:MAG: hypothetical protein WAU68_01725 [Vitreimonas sp.]